MGLSGNENKCSGAYTDAAGRYSGRVSGRKRSHDACLRAVGGASASESFPAEAIPSQPGCILLAAAYLFGTLMAGVLQALCDAEEMETIAYYLDCWRGVFAASSTAQAVGLFGAELAVVLGAAAVFLLLGLSAVGPLPIFLFAMLYGTGSGLLSAQLLNSLGAKQLVLFLLTASLPTALAAGALCLFGASALQVSSRIHAFSFGRGDKGSHPAGARLLVGQFALLAVCLCPLCGAATGLVCLANRLMQAG